MSNTTPPKRFKFWIGDRIKNIQNFANIDFHTYLLNKQIVIIASHDIVDDYSPYESDKLKEIFQTYGGSLFESVNGVINFINFSVAGKDNFDSWAGEYLRGPVTFETGSEVRRVAYKNSSQRSALCSRVLTASGAYMITYNLKDSLESTKHFSAFIEAIRDYRTFVEKKLEQPVNLARSTTTHNAQQTIVIPATPVNNNHADVSSGASMMGAIAGVATGLAVESLGGELVDGVINLAKDVFDD